MAALEMKRMFELEKLCGDKVRALLARGFAMSFDLPSLKELAASTEFIVLAEELDVPVDELQAFAWVQVEISNVYRHIENLEEFDMLVVYLVVLLAARREELVKSAAKT